MKQKSTLFIALLLCGAISTGYSQSISPAIANAGGGWGTVGGYLFAYNIGELTAVSTAAAADLIVTQGLLQPLAGGNNSPLPVSLVRFTGVKKAGYNQLDWVTAAESGQTVFELQRSSDGVGFTTVCTTPARNLSSGSTYTYNDYDPFENRAYYRLKIVENSGATRYSVVVLLRHTPGSHWTVFPNPVKGGGKLFVTLQNENGAQTALLVLTDAAGRVVQNQLLPLSNGNQTHTLTAPLAAGTYFLTVTGVAGVQNQKIIIY